MRLNIPSWIIYIALGWVALLGPGNIEGRLFPVIKTMNIEATADNTLGGDWVRVSGDVEKVRSWCEPLYIEWKAGQRGSGGKPVALISPALNERKPGPISFRDWLVNVAPPYVLVRATHADILHQCYLPLPFTEARLNFFWITRTRFWQ